jgi:hypothetical protein
LLLLKEHLVVDKQKQPQHIVLVTEFPEKGTHFSGVILTKNHHIAQGHFSNTWLKSAFVKFKGSITLSNE